MTLQNQYMLKDCYCCCAGVCSITQKKKKKKELWHQRRLCYRKYQSCCLLSCGDFCSLGHNTAENFLAHKTRSNIQCHAEQNNADGFSIFAHFQSILEPLVRVTVHSNNCFCKRLLQEHLEFCTVSSVIINSVQCRMRSSSAPRSFCVERRLVPSLSSSA